MIIINKEREEKHKKDVWDKRSPDESRKNYELGKSFGNPWNNTQNPNWATQMFDRPYNSVMLNDPQRIEENHRIEDNNGNKKVMKDKKYRDDIE